MREKAIVDVAVGFANLDGTANFFVAKSLSLEAPPQLRFGQTLLRKRTESADYNVGSQLLFGSRYARRSIFRNSILEGLAQLSGDLIGQFTMFFQIGLGVLTALPDARFTIRVP